MEESVPEDGSAGPATAAAATTSVADSVVVITPAEAIPSIEVGPTVAAAWGSHLGDACKSGDVLRAANAICGGADVGRAASGEPTPLHIAASNGHADICTLLLKSFADPNGRDSAGCTALHAAAAGGHPTIVRILLDHGALADLVNRDGQSAADVAASDEVREVLLEDPDDYGFHFRPRERVLYPSAMGWLVQGRVLTSITTAEGVVMCMLMPIDPPTNPVEAITRRQLVPEANLLPLDPTSWRRFQREHASMMAPRPAKKQRRHEEVDLVGAAAPGDPALPTGVQHPPTLVAAGASRMPPFAVMVGSATVTLPPLLHQILLERSAAVVSDRAPQPVPQPVTIETLLGQFEIAASGNVSGAAAAAEAAADASAAGKQKEGSAAEKAVSGVVTDIRGLSELFDRCLASSLLYRAERRQHDAAIAEHPDLRPSQLYGAEHLLRLVVKLPELLTAAGMKGEALTKCIRLAQGLLEFIEQNVAVLFPQEFHEAASAQAASAAAQQQAQLLQQQQRQLLQQQRGHVAKQHHVTQQHQQQGVISRGYGNPSAQAAGPPMAHHQQQMPQQQSIPQQYQQPHMQQMPQPHMQQQQQHQYLQQQHQQQLLQQHHEQQFLQQQLMQQMGHGHPAGGHVMAQGHHMQQPQQQQHQHQAPAGVHHAGMSNQQGMHHGGPPGALPGSF